MEKMNVSDYPKLLSTIFCKSEDGISVWNRCFYDPWGSQLKLAQLDSFRKSFLVFDGTEEEYAK